SGASTIDNLYRYASVSIIGGTGQGQCGRVITGYVGSTRVATVVPPWTTIPDATSLAVIVPAGSDVETWIGVAPAALSGTFVQSDVEQWKTGTVPATSVAGVPLVDAKYLLGTIFAT